VLYRRYFISGVALTSLVVLVQHRSALDPLSWKNAMTRAYNPHTHKVSTTLTRGKHDVSIEPVFFASCSSPLSLAVLESV